MKKAVNNHVFTFVLSLCLIAISACSKESPAEALSKVLTVDTNKIEFPSIANSVGVTITADVDSWTISSSDTSWITLSRVSGNSGSTLVNIAVSKNTGSAVRSAVVIIKSSQAVSVQVNLTQLGAIPIVSTGLYPSYNTNPVAADPSGMSSSAVQLAAKIKLGWNIGNTLEATGGETAWGNPKVTKALLDFVKQSGFNAIRIPCSWNQNLANNSTAEIKIEWLNRVKEVVQYCVDNDLYVIVNIHWDGGWLENNCTAAQKEANNAKQKAFWEQIATQLRDFDEHLLFASANEPNVDNATQMTVLTSYHQTFIDAVRSTGGKNTYRTLVVQGPSTDIEKTNKLMGTLPTDKVAGRMMVEVHYYTPYNFCLMDKDADWGKMFYYWGANYHTTPDLTRNSTYGEEAELDSQFKAMKTQFVDKGIPVLLGEFGAIRRTNLTGDALSLHLASRAYYLKYIVKQAKANGILPFYWDAGGMGTNGSAIFNRTNTTVFDTQALEAMLQGLQ